MTKYHVYSSMLGGYLAMDFTTKKEAQEVADDWILDGYEDTRIELKEKKE